MFDPFPIIQLWKLQATAPKHLIPHFQRRSHAFNIINDMALLFTTQLTSFIWTSLLHWRRRRSQNNFPAQHWVVWRLLCIRKHLQISNGKTRPGNRRNIQTTIRRLSSTRKRALRGKSPSVSSSSSFSLSTTVEGENLPRAYLIITRYSRSYVSQRSLLTDWLCGYVLVRELFVVEMTGK